MFNKIFKSNNNLGFNKSDLLFLFPGIALFLTITLSTITKSSVWFDEAFGAYLIRFDFWDIARYTAVDVHPPLYYWLLKIWSLLFGNSELALRSMSVLFGVVAIVFGYLLVKRLFNQNTAKLSLLFMVLSPMLIRYSQEMRMYTMVVAIALAATYILTIAVESKKRWPWAVYGLLVGLGMLTHYFIAIIWISHWIWRAYYVLKNEKKSNFIKKFFTQCWIRAHVLALLVFGAWLPFFATQLVTVQAFGFWIPPVNPSTLLNYLTNVVYYQDVTAVNGWFSFGFIALIVLVSILAIKTYKKIDNDKRQSLILISVISFVPVILLFMSSMPPHRSSFIDRYLITSALMTSIFIGIVFAYGLSKVSFKYKTAAILFTILVMSIGVINVLQMGNYNKNSHASNGTRQIIDLIKSKSDSGQPIIAATPWLYYEAAFYSTNSNTVYFIEPSDYPFGSLAMLKDNDDFKIKDISEFSKTNSVVWYVGYSSEGKLTAPYENWEPIQEVSVNDSVSNNPAYKAMQFRIK